jgi:Gram-negative bacterial TonB protein C-terminal
MSFSAIGSTAKAPLRLRRAPFTERGALRLLVKNDSFWANLRDSLLIIAIPTARKRRVSSYHLLRGADVARVRVAGRHLGASLLLHCSLVGLLIYLPHAVPAQALPLSTRRYAEKIYYLAPQRNTATLPRLVPAGLGGRPGSGSLSNRLPALGSTSVLHRNLTIVSKPSRPDNARQTIYQPASPPDLRITTEQKVPNIVLGQPSEMPKAPLTPVISKPKQSINAPVAMDAPSIATSANPATPLTTFLKPSENRPKLPIPLSSGGAPMQRSGGGSQVESGGNSSDEVGLVALGVDPADPSNQISLPGGNRWGEFSLAPPAGGHGSPGGDASGVMGGGGGGAGLGGDGSTGVGSGGGGGGGGRTGGLGPVSISGEGAAGSGGGGSLDGAPLSTMVFPVEAPAPTITKNALVISAGPIGGGGTSVYGALNCGKIYSIFLPMPGKNWSLQYCNKLVSGPKTSVEVNSNVIHLDTGLVPPYVDLAHRFDFKRIPVPVEKSHRAIVLKGVIAVDGTVQRLVVYQGVIPEMDEAARIAFSRWHFKPAMKDGKPVEVEILVGIPPLADEDRVNR